MLKSTLICVIGDFIWILRSLKCDMMLLFGIAGKTLRIMILLVGFLNRLVLIVV